MIDKSILLIGEDGFEFEPALKWLGLSRREVNTCTPDQAQELIDGNKPLFTLQCGCNLVQGVPFALDEAGYRGFADAAYGATADKFVGLHHHDEFSIRDGLGSVKQLVALLKAQRRSFCCITNHGVVGGWIRQYKTCMENGIKPIFGMEAYVAQRAETLEGRKDFKKANHLVLIASTQEGFYNIIRIHNDAQLNGFYYTPRMNHEAARKWGKGVVATSACCNGEIPSLLLEKKWEDAERLYRFYKECFDEFYIELSLIEAEFQRTVNYLLIEFAQKVGAPMVVTLDSHYLEQEHDDTHSLLMYIRQGKTVKDKKEKDDVWEFDIGNLYYRNYEQVNRLFSNGFVEKSSGTVCGPYNDHIFTRAIFEEAVRNTRRIAMQSEEIKLDSTPMLPKVFDNPVQVLRQKINDGFRWRKLAGGTEYRDIDGNKQVVTHSEYAERIKTEFATITELGWTDYILIVEDIVSRAKRDYGEWVIGAGRGSAASSLVAYVLGITDVNPLHYKLLFGRFMDRSRPDCPDIDMDFDPRVRDKIKQQIVETYGQSKVCSIGTYQYYRTSSVIFDVARALGYDIHEVREVTKKIDATQSFETDDGTERRVDDMTMDEIVEHYPELKAYFANHEDVRRHASILRNQVKNMSTHAGGVIISNLDLGDRIPILYDKPSSDDRKVISAWAEAPGKSEELSAVGLVKFDILGLNYLSIISDTVKYIQSNRGIDLRRADMPHDDRVAIKLCSKKDLVGIFQLDHPSTLPIATDIGLESIYDIAALTSLIRPGPRDMGMEMEYAKRKRGEPYDAPAIMREILPETYSIIIYQEQAMRVAKELAGFSDGDAYKYLKTIAKKIPEKMAAMKPMFFAGAQKAIDEGRCTLAEVEYIWTTAESLAGYAFNASIDVDTPMELADGTRKRIGDVAKGDVVWCCDVSAGRFVQTEVVANHDHGSIPAYAVEFEGGSNLVCSAMHKFMTMFGQRPIGEIAGSGLEVVHADAVTLPIYPAPITMRRVQSAKYVGEKHMCDLEVAHPSHNYVLPGGAVTSNSHASSYSAISGVLLWLKHNYFVEYMCSLLNNTEHNKKKHGESRLLVSYINYIRANGVAVLPPDINKSGEEFRVENGAIRFGLGHIKNVSGQAGVIQQYQPIESIEDFYARVRVMPEKRVEEVTDAESPDLFGGTHTASTGRRPNIRQVESLIAAGAFDSFGKRNDVIAAYYAAKRESKPAPVYTDSEWSAKEEEMVGVCLTHEPLYEKYAAEMEKFDALRINAIAKRKKCNVLGLVKSIVAKKSKSGNRMLNVTISDNINSMNFFVFTGAMQHFRDNVREGTIACLPLGRFDGSDMWFFDEKKKIEVIARVS
jgi:DNA-directed DNA polymerase III PolC